MIKTSYAQEVRVLTYNIYHGESPSKPGTSNLNEISELINKLKPDVVALQEIDSMTGRTERIYGKRLDLMKVLSENTGFKDYFGKAMNYDGGAYGEGILIKESNSFSTNLLPNPYGGESRAIAWVKTEMKNGEEFYFGGTHLCHQFSGNRVEQVKSILNQAGKLEKPVIWVGDLNFAPDSEEYKTISKPWEEAGVKAGNIQNTYGTAEKGGRIDYIWYDSEKFELIEYQVIPVNYSYHFPVWAVLKFKK